MLPPSFKLRPSAASVWISCNAAPSMWAALPPDRIELENDAALEGTAAHWCGSELLGGRVPVVGSVHQNGVVIDETMLRHAEEYRDIVAAWNIPVYVEQYLTISSIYPDFGGTPDAWGYDRKTATIKIIDFKYGFQIVEPFENWQMLCYVAGIIEKLQLDGYLDQIYTVEFYVFQPRVNHVEGHLRTWKTKASNLRPFFNKLQSAAENVYGKNPVASTGKQCRYCEARHRCTVLLESSYVAVELSQMPDSFDLNVTQAGKELMQIEAAIEILKSRKTGLEGQLMHALSAGNVSPHFTLDRVKCRTKWIEGSESTVLAMGEILGIDLAKPREPISPTQARKKNIDDSVINLYSVTPIGEQKLVRLSTLKTRKLFER